MTRSHDDLRISAALCTILDDRAAVAGVVQRLYPLVEIDGEGWHA